MRSRDRTLVCLLAVLSATAACKSRTAGSCEDYNDCPAGDVCVDGRCTALCNADSHCGAQACCVDGVCAPCENGRPPVILSVDGTGSLQASEALANHHLVNRLVITGTGLAGGRVSLEAVEPSLGQYTLDHCGDDTDTRIEVALPEVLAAELAGRQESRFLLTVANQADACTHAVHIVQGEQGPDGYCDPTDCSSQAFPGASAVDTLAARAVNPSGAPLEISFEIDAVEQISVPPADGIWLGVLDRSSHELSTDPDHNRAYETADPNQLLQLVVELGSLTEDQLVVLISRGNLSGVIAQQSGGTTLADELIALGAGVQISVLGGSDALVFVGHRAAGSGNAVVVTSSTGAAEATVVLVDEALLGPGTNAGYAGTCSGDQKMSGIDPAGGVVCSTDMDTQCDDYDCTVGTLYANNWLRTNGDTGWYSQTYGGGWHMTDATWIRSYGGKQVYVDRAIATPSVQVGGNPLGWPDQGGTAYADAVNGNPNLWLTGQDSVHVRAPNGLHVGGNLYVAGNAYMATPNEVNNAGGSPCMACDGDNISWRLTCASRYCRARGHAGGLVAEMAGCSPIDDYLIYVVCF